MSDIPKHIQEAVDRGYSTAKERRTWTADDRTRFEVELEVKAQRQREEYEAGDSNARLKELILNLQESVRLLESRMEHVEEKLEW